MFIDVSQIRSTYVGALWALTSRETNRDTASNVEVAGAVAKGLPDTSLALLAPTSSFCSVDEVALFDPAAGS